MPPSTYRKAGNRFAVASASTALTAGTLAKQEGTLGIVITGAASGHSTVLDTEGVHNLVVPSSTVKGDLIWADLTGGVDVYPVTLSRTPAAGNTLIGVAWGDRGSDTYGLLKLAMPGITYDETAAVAVELAAVAAAIPTSTVAAVATADADATYGQPEADLINALKVAVNLIIARLQTAHIVA